MIVKSHNWTQSWHSKCVQIAWTQMLEQSSDVDEREREGDRVRTEQKNET